MHLADIRREPKVFRDVGVILRRVIAKGNEAHAQVFLALQLARLEDVRADLLDIPRGRGDIAALATCTVLNKNEITGVLRG